MIKREIVMEALKKAEEEMEKQIVELKVELADLRKAVIDILASKPEELWNIEEVGKALKPSKIVCLTRKKFEQKVKDKDHNCDSCQKTGHCSDECHCENSSILCDPCLDFLFGALDFMINQKDIDVFFFEGEILMGIHIE